MWSFSVLDQVLSGTEGRAEVCQGLAVLLNQNSRISPFIQVSGSIFNRFLLVWVDGLWLSLIVYCWIFETFYESFKKCVSDFLFFSCVSGWVKLIYSRPNDFVWNDSLVMSSFYFWGDLVWINSVETPRVFLLCDYPMLSTCVLLSASPWCVHLSPPPRVFQSKCSICQIAGFSLSIGLSVLSVPSLYPCL